MTSAEFKKARKAKKMTQAEFGDYLGVSQEMVSQIESGLRLVPESMAKKLSKANKKGMF